MLPVITSLFYQRLKIPHVSQMLSPTIDSLPEVFVFSSFPYFLCSFVSVRQVKRDIVSTSKLTKSKESGIRIVSYGSYSYQCHSYLSNAVLNLCSLFRTWDSDFRCLKTNMAPLLWKFDTVIFDCGIFGAVSFCIFLAALYVSSLYFGASSKTR